MGRKGYDTAHTDISNWKSLNIVLRGRCRTSMALFRDLDSRPHPSTTKTEPSASSDERPILSNPGHPTQPKTNLPNHPRNPLKPPPHTLPPTPIPIPIQIKQMQVLSSLRMESLVNLAEVAGGEGVRYNLRDSPLGSRMLGWRLAAWCLFVWKSTPMTLPVCPQWTTQPRWLSPRWWPARGTWDLALVRCCGPSLAPSGRPSLGRWWCRLLGRACSRCWRVKGRFPGGAGFAWLEYLCGRA